MAEEIDVAALMNKLNGGNMKDNGNQYKNYDPEKNRRDRSAGNYRQNNGGNGGGRKYGGNDSRGNDKRFGGKSGQGGGGRPKEGNDYVGAPYNFVSFSNQVYEYPKGKLTAHNDMREELSTGEISYEITAKTPVFVDDGNQEFYTNPEGKYAIPGSTMRGLIRNNVQILGLASFSDDIDDYALMYRNVAAGLQKKRYNTVLGADTITLNTGAKNKQVSVLKNVQAGYVKNENGKYIIYKTTVDKISADYKDMNYYPLSERKIIEEYLQLENKGKFAYEYFRAGGKNILQNEFKPFERNVLKGRTQYKGVKNQNYVPYMKEISYELKNLKDVTAVGAPGKYSRKGYVVSTGWMSQKKMIYIIPEIDMAKDPIQIPSQDVEAFRIDYKKREKKLAGAYKSDDQKEKARIFFNLPENGKMKPVFYIYLQGRLYFGFTPRLRLFYDQTIIEGLPACHRKPVLDYGRAMFGYAKNQKESIGIASDETEAEKGGSYKTKLSFSDAVMAGTGENMLCERERAILGEPNPTSCLIYVKPGENDRPDTYNGKGFALRGVKQYWLHKEVAAHKVEQDQENVASGLHALKAGVKFRGKVRFQNLTKDELGLLLWSIRLNQGSRMNVGKAKSYGYGQIQVEILEARELDLEKAYGAGALALDPFRPIDVEAAVKAYKDTVNAFLGTRSIEDLPHIKEFFAMKDASLIPDNKDTRYMTLDEYKAQVRDEIMLKSALEVVKKRSE